jgi:uncharacterized membrane protein HdeD (DUF308 family)
VPQAVFVRSGPGTGTVTVVPHRWWVAVLLGAMSIVAGIIAIAYPGITLLALGIIFGVNLLFIGIVWIMVATTEGAEPGGRTLRFIVGVLAALAGLICIGRPGASIIALLFAIAFWFILVGISDLSRAVSEPNGKAIAVILGVLSIAAGIIIVGDPDIGLHTLALLAGLAFLVRGTVELLAGLYLRFG